MHDPASLSTSRVSRRDFVAASTAAAGAVAGSSLLAAPATGKVLGANDRIQFGVIGVGGMGSGHVGDLVGRTERDNIRCVAVCDVYQKRLNHNRERSGGEAFTDYRKLLDRKDIDAVIIATPDHWHSKQAIDAMEAGKDVYLQKPMTLTIEQALEVRDAAKRLKKKLQVGTQYASEPETWAGARLSPTDESARSCGRKMATAAIAARGSSTGPSIPRPAPRPRAKITSTGTCGWGTSSGEPRRFLGTPTTFSVSASTGPTTAGWPRTSCTTRCALGDRGRRAQG